MSSLMVDIYTPTGYGKQPFVKENSMAATARKSDQSKAGCCCSSRRATHAGHRDHQHHAGHGAHEHAEQEPQDQDGVRDPVCGMLVDPHTTQHRHQHDGRTYYFCSGGCLAKFIADPAKYLDQITEERRQAFPKARSIPARCTRRFVRSGRARARSAGWRWSPCLQRLKRAQMPS